MQRMICSKLTHDNNLLSIVIFRNLFSESHLRAIRTRYIRVRVVNSRVSVSELLLHLWFPLDLYRWSHRTDLSGIIDCSGYFHWIVNILSMKFLKSSFVVSLISTIRTLIALLQNAKPS